MRLASSSGLNQHLSSLCCSDVPFAFGFVNGFVATSYVAPPVLIGMRFGVVFFAGNSAGCPATTLLRTHGARLSL